MDLSLIWQAGQVMCVLGLLYGAYLALMDTYRRSIGRFPGNGVLGRLASGMVVMDSQHQGLRDQIKGLQAALGSGQPVHQLGASIDAFLLEITQHFHSEEALHAAAGYPEAVKHAALHRELERSAATLMERFLAGTSEIDNVFRFLAHDMLGKHGSEADQDFVLSLER